MTSRSYCMVFPQTCGRDKQFAGQSQWGDCMLVNQSRQAACQDKKQSQKVKKLNQKPLQKYFWNFTLSLEPAYRMNTQLLYYRLCTCTPLVHTIQQILFLSPCSQLLYTVLLWTGLDSEILPNEPDFLSNVINCYVSVMLKIINH